MAILDTTGDRVIDADGHVVELPDMWQAYVEPAYRERAPGFARDQQGRMVQQIGDTLTGRLAVELTRRPDGDLERAIEVLRKL